eukprot:5902550-Alexandrium_andersonii.AAC.1
MPPPTQLGWRDVAQHLAPSSRRRRGPFVDDTVQLLPRPGRLAEPGNGGDFLPRGRPLGRAPERG